jgi:hypothetical protein
MQVSNSTGQNTDYRVGTSSGGQVNGMSDATYTDSTRQASLAPVELTRDETRGQLPPGGSETCKSAGPFIVEFVIDEKVVATAQFAEDPGQVILVERGGKYSIEAAAAVEA